MNIDEKIRELKQKESFETFQMFMQDTKSLEIMVVVLKAHLYMESELVRMLTETVIDEQYVSGMAFKQKLDLANSMGLLGDIYGALKKVNSIRNLLAHNMSYVFDEKDFEDLLSTLSKEDKDDYILDYVQMKKIYYDETIPELNFKIQVLLHEILMSLMAYRRCAKEAIVLQLKKKAIDIILECYKKQG